MNKILIRITLSLLFWGCVCFSSHAGEPVSRDSVYFSYRQGSSILEESRKYNTNQLAWLDRFLRESIASESIILERVEVRGYSSIEGTYTFNMEISRKRAEAFAQYLEQTYRMSNYCPVSTSWVGEDWQELARLVSASDLADKQKVLSIIDEVPIFSGREKKLMDLRGGKPYKEMERLFFPLLRRVEVLVVTTYLPDQPAISSQSSLKEKEQEVAPAVKSEPLAEVNQGIVEAVEELGELVQEQTAEAKRPLLALKTNLLSGLLLTPSLEAELFLTPRFSLGIEGHYAQWVFDGKRREIYGWGFSPELRWYPSSRHYLGAYYQQGEFDLRFSDTGRMGDYQGGGLSYGYVLPLSSGISPHWFMEFGLGLGYSRVEYDRYYFYNSECKAFEKHRDRNYWGPTKLKVSIVYRFNTSAKEK